MEARIIYFYQETKGDRMTINMRNIEYWEPYTMTNVFYAIKDAADCNDLTIRLNNIIRGCVTLSKINGNLVSFLVESESLGRFIMRVRLKQKTANE